MTVKQSRIISKVLSPACGVWLRSQVEQVEDLQVKIEGDNRQILTGHVPRISILAHNAVYQGLHLSKIQLLGEHIRINLGQILKGKPLRLLESVPVAVQLLVEEADLKASLRSPLLSTALTDLLSTLLESGGVKNLNNSLKNQQINWQQVVLKAKQLTLAGVLTDTTGKTTPVVIRAGLTLASSHELRFDPLEIEIHSGLPLNLNSFHLDLGSEVDFEELTLIPGQLVCQVRLTVTP